MTKTPPQICRVIPKSKQPAPAIEGGEVQLICAIKDSIRWALRESRSPGAEVEVEVSLKYEGFYIAQRMSVLKVQQNWGESVNQRAYSKSRMGMIESDQGEMDHALRMIRQELNTLPLSTCVTRKSSIRLVLVFEEGWMKSCNLSRMRAALKPLTGAID